MRSRAQEDFEFYVCVYRGDGSRCVSFEESDRRHVDQDYNNGVSYDLKDPANGAPLKLRKRHVFLNPGVRCHVGPQVEPGHPLGTSHLTKVNYTPSFATDTPLDYKIKS